MKTLIIGNWKMNPQTIKEAKKLFLAVEKGIKKNKNAEIVICPPFLFIPNLKSKTLKIGAQNCFFENKGAFTGEISAEQLKNSGCQYIILGHSERRQNFKETDEMINKKLLAVLEAGLIPILCIGETQAERDTNQTEEILKAQLNNGLKNIHNLLSHTWKGSPAFIPNSIVIAYEPVWSIGTGKACSPEEARNSRIFIEKIISGILGDFLKTQTSGICINKVAVIYGGSVKSDNASSYIKEAGFFGLLVGGASLNPEEFLKIINVV